MPQNPARLARRDGVVVVDGLGAGVGDVVPNGLGDDAVEAMGEEHALAVGVAQRQDVDVLRAQHFPTYSLVHTTNLLSYVISPFSRWRYSRRANEEGVNKEEDARADGLQNTGTLTFRLYADHRHPSEHM